MADEVDAIVDAWRSEVPGLDVSPMQVLSRVSRLSRHLDLARRDAFAAHGLEVWEFDVLAALRREGPPYVLSPGELTRQTLSTSGTMTNRIDRLEEKGLVVREPNADDRRGVRVRLTPDGMARVSAALSDLLVFERDLLEGVDPEVRGQLADALRRLLVSFEGR
ncbi:MAG: MarR family transcriptional regulator [Propionicimonas sp.]|nr:MarR family transcriptional regulator [Propionicimonas sp.]